MTADPGLTALAAEAYLYGFPLVFDLQEVGRLAESGMGSLPPSPFNAFSHATGLAGPDDRFVSVNNDTVYSIAHLDASAGPLTLRVPDTAGRYYVLQFVDAWTNNFAYVGRRATGTAAGTFLLTPPGWSGEVPEGATRIALPTMIASIVGRFACDGPDDLPAVRALQQRLTLEAPAGPLAGLPAPAADPADELFFFERLRTWMAAFPPSAEERAHQQRFEPLGLLGDAPFDPAQRAALAAGLSAGRERLEALTKSGEVAPSGWSTAVHAFDYNRDWFEIGTIDAPEWKIADVEQAHAIRATSARVGLWGNHAYEAYYSQTFVDGDGEPLDGARTYEIRFDAPPPVDAFWSLTMYDTPDYYLVANPIGRYSIGDRTPGLVRAEDGSLTLVLSHEEPADPTARANWLPTPAGGFRPLIRLYQPRQSVLDGAYVLPPIRRTA